MYPLISHNRIVFSHASRFLLLVVMSICALAANAAQTRLSVQTVDNTTTYIELTSLPRITFTSTEMVVSTDEQQFIFGLADLSRYGFVDSESGIDDPQAEITSVSIRLEGRSLISSASDVAIYTVDGQKVVSRHLAQYEPVRLDALLPGVYVVETGGSSFKIALK